MKGSINSYILRGVLVDEAVDYNPTKKVLTAGLTGNVIICINIIITIIIY
jgi:hypothetical protein